jgi:hypothetical protein
MPVSELKGVPDRWHPYRVVGNGLSWLAERLRSLMAIAP